MKGLLIDSATFNPGESPLKHGKDIVASHCQFNAKYPFWHGDRIRIDDSVFDPLSRAAIWYSRHLRMKGCRIDAPKMFRRSSHILIENCTFSDAAETGWSCQGVVLKNVSFHNGDYLFMNTRDIAADGLQLQGNYAFDGAKNIEIRNAVLTSKDAFWNSENVTVHDSILDGEYLGWHSQNLRLVNCIIKGTQPLCFATDLVMENCQMDASCDLGFEYTSVHASLQGHVVSIKNPLSGEICADTLGEVIIDEHVRAPNSCRIHARNPANDQVECCAVAL